MDGESGVIPHLSENNITHNHIIEQKWRSCAPKSAGTQMYLHFPGSAAFFQHTLIRTFAIFGANLRRLYSQTVAVMLSIRSATHIGKIRFQQNNTDICCFGEILQKGVNFFYIVMYNHLYHQGNYIINEFFVNTSFSQRQKYKFSKHFSFFSHCVS